MQLGQNGGHIFHWGGGPLVPPPVEPPLVQVPVRIEGMNERTNERMSCCNGSTQTAIVLRYFAHIKPRKTITAIKIETI